MSSTWTRRPASRPASGQVDPEGLLYQAMSRREALPLIRRDDHLTRTPSSIDLARGESQFVSETAREYLLKTCLRITDSIGGSTVIIDSPPSLGVLAVNCLAAARGLAVVVQPGGFELRALAHLEQAVHILNDRVNPSLKDRRGHHDQLPLPPEHHRAGPGGSPSTRYRLGTSPVGFENTLCDHGGNYPPTEVVPGDG